MTTNNLFELSCRLYKLLDEIPGEQDRGRKLIEARRTEVFGKLGISMTYYSPLWRGLESMGCIGQVSKAGHGRVGKILLHHPPTDESFDFGSIRHLTEHSEFDTLASRIEILERRLQGIEVGEAFVALHMRIEALERGR